MSTTRRGSPGALFDERRRVPCAPRISRLSPRRARCTRRKERGSLGGGSHGAARLSVLLGRLANARGRTAGSRPEQAPGGSASGLSQRLAEQHCWRRRRAQCSHCSISEGLKRGQRASAWRKGSGDGPLGHSFTLGGPEVWVPPDLSDPDPHLDRDRAAAPPAHVVRVDGTRISSIR
jgi:hypothetical protein